LSALLALTLALGVLAPGRPQAGAAPAAPEDPARIVAAWREALELDLPAEVLGPGPAAVAPGGALAREGEAIALVARALFDAGRGEEAARLLAGARPREGPLAHVELEGARELLERDRLDEALAALSAQGAPARPRQSDVAHSWLLLGRTLARLGRLEEAVPLLERYVSMEPLGEGAYAALHMLSQAALRRGDGAAARELVQRAQQAGQWRAYYNVRRLQVREEPDEPLPRLGLAQLLLQAGEIARGQALLEELAARCPGYAPGWFHLGEVRRAQQQWPAAKAAYDKALELDPTLALARYNRAVLLLRAGDGPAARADLEAIVGGPQADDPRLALAHLALARLLLASGDRSGAEQRYGRYRELGGTDPLEP